MPSSSKKKSSRKAKILPQFSIYSGNKPLLDLLEIQRKSFFDLLERGIKHELSKADIFRENAKISGFTQELELAFNPETYKLVSPNFTPKEAILKGKTYSCKLYVQATLNIRSSPAGSGESDVNKTSKNANSSSTSSLQRKNPSLSVTTPIPFKSSQNSLSSKEALMRSPYFGIEDSTAKHPATFFTSKMNQVSPSLALEGTGGEVKEVELLLNPSTKLKSTSTSGDILCYTESLPKRSTFLEFYSGSGERAKRNTFATDSQLGCEKEDLKVTLQSKISTNSFAKIPSNLFECSQESLAVSLIANPKIHTLELNSSINLDYLKSAILRSISPRSLKSKMSQNPLEIGISNNYTEREKLYGLNESVGFKEETKADISSTTFTYGSMNRRSDAEKKQRFKEPYLRAGNLKSRSDKNKIPFLWLNRRFNRESVDTSNYWQSCWSRVPIPNESCYTEGVPKNTLIWSCKYSEGSLGYARKYNMSQIEDFSKIQYKREVPFSFVDSYTSFPRPTSSPSLHQSARPSNPTVKKVEESVKIFRPWIFLGELPLMTKRGHFILNGSPRVIVNQIARCPGIYFQEKRRGVGFEQEVRVSADLIPQRGPWLRIQSDWEGRFWARLKREGRVKYATLYSAFQEFEKEYNAPLVSLITHTSSAFPKSEILAFHERKAKEDRQKKALVRLFKNSTRYSLGKQGRLRINQRVHLSYKATPSFISPKTGESNVQFPLKSHLVKVSELNNSWSSLPESSFHLVCSPFMDSINLMYIENVRQFLLSKKRREHGDDLASPSPLPSFSAKTGTGCSFPLYTSKVQRAYFGVLNQRFNKENSTAFTPEVMRLQRKGIPLRGEGYYDQLFVTPPAFWNRRQFHNFPTLVKKKAIPAGELFYDFCERKDLTVNNANLMDLESNKYLSEIPPLNELSSSHPKENQVKGEENLLMAADINAVHTCLEHLLEGQGFTDDIDHLKNRLVRTSGKLLQQQLELGLHRLNEVMTPLLGNLIQGQLLASSLPFTPKVYEKKKSTDYVIKDYKKAQTEKKGGLASSDLNKIQIKLDLAKKRLNKARDRGVIGSTSKLKEDSKKGVQWKSEFSLENETPFRWLRTSKPVNNAFREFFGSNPLSQYMDQTNPLAEITHKRRLSSMGPGGIKRETAGMEVRGIHPTHYGRVCPIETPEGKNAGLVNSPTVYGRIGNNGFMETPLYQVLESQVQRDRWAFFSAQQEEDEESSLATSDTGSTRFNLLSHVPIPVQTANNPLAHFQQVERNRVGYKALSPVQTISIATALIPFLEHDDANRALMGSNMQRQAIPLLSPERPIVGTGFEPMVMVESGQAVQATKVGCVSHVSASKIILESIESTWPAPPSFRSCEIDPPGYSRIYSGDSISNMYRTFFHTVHFSAKAGEISSVINIVDQKKEPSTPMLSAKGVHSSVKTPCFGIKDSTATGYKGVAGCNNVWCNSRGFKIGKYLVSEPLSIEPLWHVKKLSFNPFLNVHFVKNMFNIALSSNKKLFRAEPSSVFAPKCTRFLNSIQIGKGVKHPLLLNRRFNKEAVTSKMSQDQTLASMGSYSGWVKEVEDFLNSSKKLISGSISFSNSDALRAKKSTSTSGDIACYTEGVPKKSTFPEFYSGFGDDIKRILFARYENFKEQSFLLQTTAFGASALLSNQRFQEADSIFKDKNRFLVATSLLAPSKDKDLLLEKNLRHVESATFFNIAPLSTSLDSFKSSAISKKNITLNSLSELAVQQSATFALKCTRFTKTLFSPSVHNLSSIALQIQTIKDKPASKKWKDDSKKNFVLNQRFHSRFVDPGNDAEKKNNYSEEIKEKVLFFPTDQEQKIEDLPEIEENFKDKMMNKVHGILHISKKIPHQTATKLHLCSAQKAFLLKKEEQPLQIYQRSNQETCLSQRPLVQEGDWVERGDFLADCSASSSGDLALGKNVRVAYMPWEGYNFEDAIVISDRLVANDVYTSIHIERYEIKVSKNSQGKERITNQIPSLPSRRLNHLDNSGIARVSSWVQPGDILVGKVVELKRPLSPYERLAWELASRLSPTSPEREKWLSKVWLEDISLRLPPGVCGRVINFQVLSTEWSEKEQLAHPLEVHVYLAVKRKIQVGDKLAGRHGNKGIVSIVLPRQDMPYLGDGSSVDMVLNPLGVPSRMNLGQIFECLLGLAGSQLGCNFKVTPFDEIAGGEASRSLVFLKLYQCRLVYKQQWLFTPTFPGKNKLFDGRTGEPFENWVTVGQAYMLKLIHMVDHKIHARSTGPYSLFTRQPVRGRSRRGGQRLGEMEVWAVEGFGAAYTLQEFLTIKSDDLKARAALQRSFYKESDVTLGKVHISPGNPEAFRVLVSELQALCLHIQM
uniref:DNA-directed RNA polymerase subunit beta n=1 Tax=Symbiochloris handae TaxID=1853882 RepID=A0A097KJG7_9CHLO|nr:beta subunit of RNA polymerase [Symbiochloris handae]AIT93359.1 beta subunit of RNA polymerase [Symbiochloris handae]